MGDIRWYVVTATDTIMEITDRVDTPDPSGANGFAVGANAEEGSLGSFTLNVRDPDADLHLLNHRRVYAIAEDAPAGHQRVGNWWISDLDVIRGPSDKTGASRTWVLTMEDENSIIPRKIFFGADVNRAVAETDIQRIDWWMTTTEGSMVKDDLYLDRTNPKTLNPSNLVGQTADTMLSACRDASGKNYFIWFNELAIAGTIVSSSVANPTVITASAAHDLLTGASVTITGHAGSTPSINGTHIVTVLSPTTFSIPVNVTVGGTGGSVIEPRYSLAYFDFNSYTGYASAIGLSNLSSEIDSSTIFAISADTRLTRAGRRIASGNFKPYAGGNVYVQDSVVAAQYISRDVATPAINTKSSATATTEATRQLNEMNQPDDEVETEIIVTQAQINAAMHGMSITLRATHLPNYTPTSVQPGYATTANMRITRRQVRQISPTKFGIRLWLTPIPLVPCVDFELPITANGYYGDMHSFTTPADGVTYYSNATIPLEPTPGWIGNWGFYVFDYADAGAIGGSYDTAWAGAGNSAFVMIVGNKSVTGHFRYGYEQDGTHPNSAFIDVTLRHLIGGMWSDDIVAQDVLVPVAGLDYAVTTPNDGHCIHVVQFEFGRNGEPGSGWRNVGYDGATVANP